MPKGFRAAQQDVSNCSDVLERVCITDALLWTPLIMSDGPSSEDAAGWESAWLASIASEKISIPDVCCPVILTPCCQACVRALDVVRACVVPCDAARLQGAHQRRRPWLRCCRPCGVEPSTRSLGCRKPLTTTVANAFVSLTRSSTRTRSAAQARHPTPPPTHPP